MLCSPYVLPDEDFSVIHLWYSLQFGEIKISAGRRMHGKQKGIYMDVKEREKKTPEAAAEKENAKKGGNSQLWIGVLLMVVCAACLCAGQLIWKMYDGLLPMILGFIVYVGGAGAMLYAYHFGSVSLLQPLNSISYIFSTMLGAVVLKESVTPLKVVAVVVILVGVYILAAGGKKEE